MLDHPPSPDDIHWGDRAGYSKRSARLDTIIRHWAIDAATTGIVGLVRLKMPLSLPNWGRATLRPSVYQCLELVALLDARDGDASAMAWFG